jgi:hypothetical protein
MGVAAVLALGVVGTASALLYGRWSDADPAIPAPSDTAMPTAAPEETEAPDVTTGIGLPTASRLTPEVLESSDTGWVLAIFDSTFRSTTGAPGEGERVMYLVSPQGERYEVANLTQYGAPALAAWDTERHVAFVVDNRSVALTLDLASGEVMHEWQFCGEGGSMTAQDRPDDEWLLRGVCSGEGIDGIYSDDGTFVTDDGVVRGGEGVTITDVGDVQFRYEFEVAPDEAYRAHHADGRDLAVRVPDGDVACYPMGPSLLGGLAVQCWGEGDSVTLWNLDPDGGEPIMIASPATLGAIEAASGGSLPAEGAMLTGYKLAGDFDAVLTSHPAAILLGADSPLMVNNGEYRAQSVFGGVGQVVLVTGGGALWTWNALASGETVTLIPVPEPSDDGVRVGVSEAGAIMHP